MAIQCAGRAREFFARQTKVARQAGLSGAARPSTPRQIHHQPFQPLDCHPQILGLLLGVQGSVHRPLDAPFTMINPSRRLLQPLEHHTRYIH